MRIGRTATRVLAGITATVAALAPGAAAHASGSLGTGSLAQVLAKDSAGFDRNPNDFDILTAAVGAVLKAKPNSPVAVLADGKVALTAFLPDDRAFEYLARDLSGSHRLPSEQKAFGVVAGLGIDTVEGVLLYHVVPGATITRQTAVRANGTKLTTASGATITVRVSGWCRPRVSLQDADRNARDPRVVKFDINQGNRQIAHAIDRVLRPVDLP